MKELFTEEKILELVKQEIKNQVAEVLNDKHIMIMKQVIMILLSREI